MWKKSIHTFKILPNNRLEKEVQRIVTPFNVILTAVCSPKFRIRNGYITPSSKKIHILLFFGITACNVWSGYAITKSQNEYTTTSIVSYFFSLTIFFYYIDFILFTSCNVLHSRRQVSLILKIQELHRNIDITKKVKNYIIWTWIWFLATFSVFLISFLSFLMNLDRIFFIHLSTYFANLQFDLNFIYSVRIMTLLVIYLKAWTKSVLDVNEEEQNKEYFMEKFKTYQNILRAYKIFTLCFKDIIMCRTTDSILRGLSIFEMRLQQNKISPATFVSFLTLLWSMKNLSLIFITSIQCEKFYIAIEEAESVCLQRLNNPDCPNYLKCLCKRVIQVNRTFSRMNVYGLFTVDATLPIPLGSIVANYVLVLLQFAVL